LLQGYTELQLRNFDLAGKHFTEVLEMPLDPMASYVALVNLGVLATQEKDWACAEREFRDAIEINRDAFAAPLNLAVMYRLRGELGDPPPDSRLDADALAAWKRSNWQTAVKILDGIIDRRGKVRLLFQERARLHLLLADANRAQADLNTAIELAGTATSP